LGPADSYTTMSNELTLQEAALAWAHAKTQEAHRNEILCTGHWLQQLIDEREAHEVTKRNAEARIV